MLASLPHNSHAHQSIPKTKQYGCAAQVTLALRPHQGQGAQREVALTREKIDFNPVTSQLCARQASSIIQGSANNIARGYFGISLSGSAGFRGSGEVRC